MKGRDIIFSRAFNIIKRIYGNSKLITFKRFNRNWVKLFGGTLCRQTLCRRNKNLIKFFGGT